MSPTLLSSRLKQLTKAGVIERSGKAGSFSYSLTTAGKELRPIVELMGAWGHRWVRSDLKSGDLDAGLLMWDMRRTVDSSAFPDRRVVVQFEYSDAPEGARNWWLVSENDEIDLCLDDRGYEVDLIIRCSLKVMTKVWICEHSFQDGIKSGEITVLGNPELIAQVQGWLRASPLSNLGELKSLPTLRWEGS